MEEYISLVEFILIFHVLLNEGLKSLPSDVLFEYKLYSIQFLLNKTKNMINHIYNNKKLEHVQILINSINKSMEDDFHYIPSILKPNGINFINSIYKLSEDYFTFDQINNLNNIITKPNNFAEVFWFSILRIRMYCGDTTKKQNLDAIAISIDEFLVNKKIIDKLMAYIGYNWFAKKTIKHFMHDNLSKIIRNKLETLECSND
jgi:hypothetical protein